MFISLWPGYVAYLLFGVQTLILGVEEMFRSLVSLLVDQKDKLQAEQTLRKKNSIVLTAPSEPEDRQAQGSCCAV